MTLTWPELKGHLKAQAKCPQGENTSAPHCFSQVFRGTGAHLHMLLLQAMQLGGQGQTPHQQRRFHAWQTSHQLLGLALYLDG